MVNAPFGRIQRKKGITLKKRENCYGYLMVKISMHGKEHLKTIHRLVAIAFCPRIDGFEYVNHIDGNRKNNDARNLEWVTSSENAFHTYRTLRHSQVGISHRLAKVTDEKVKECINLCRIKGSNGRSQRLIKCSCGHEQLVFVSSWAAHGKIKCRSCMILWKYF